jgi:hypothetical protein
MSPVNMTFLVGHPCDDVAGGVGAAEMHQVDPALAEIDGHPL